MAKFMIPSVRKGFSVINGKVYEVTLKAYLCDIDNEEEDVLVVENDGKEYKVGRDNLFLSVEDVKANNPTQWKNNGVYIIGNAKIDDELNADFWTFEDGKAKKNHVKLYHIHADFSGARMVITSPEIPSVTYESSEDAYMFNDVTVVHADGSEELVRGAGNLCKLTDEQRAVVNEIGRLIKTAREMGISFTTDWNDTYAFNSNEISDYALCYDRGDTCIDNPEFVNLTAECFKAGFYFPVSGDEDRLWITRKKD